MAAVHGQVDELRRPRIACDAEKITFGEYLNRWLADSVKGSVREHTYDGYESVVRVHLRPELGGVKLKSLTPAHLQNLYRRRADKGLSPGRIAFIHAVAHRALKQAVKWRLISSNPAEACDPPRVQNKEIRPLSREQVRTLFETAKGVRMGALFFVAVLTGLRVGEILGLRWEDVDFQEQTLKVNRQLIKPKSGLKLSPPKRDASRRVVDLPEKAVEALKRRKVEQLEEKLKAGKAWQETGLVFTTPLGAPLDPANQTRLYLQPLLKEAGIRPEGITFHGLRHTFATLMLRNREHPKVVQGPLGHSRISETMDRYSHFLPSMQKEAAKRLNDLF